MDEFLTARQVQDLLKVDRITVYRMLNDGRLHGNKIGQQWRFPREDVEDLLNGLKLGDDSGKYMMDEGGLPVHCFQTIQDLFSTVSQLSAILVNMQGDPITEMSHPCEFCHLVSSRSSAGANCQASYHEFVRQAENGEKHFTCHSGLNYTGAYVTLEHEPVGLFLVGGFRLQETTMLDDKTPYTKLNGMVDIPGQAIQAAHTAIPSLTDEQEKMIDTWTTAAAQAFESILQERSAFTRRLKKIADLTQIP
ncbi:MAG: helix-turn-helix domain-containing protein [Leptolinea sp.]|jgi:excisionase family DNA binding protein|nr:helix-turn-helix domain-containing protein [Leptolinea sp.]